MKTIITTLAAVLLLAACSTVQPQAPAPTTEQTIKVFESGVYWGAMSLQEISKSGKYKDTLIPMDVVQSTAKEKLMEAQKAAAEAKASAPKAVPVPASTAKGVPK